MDTIESGQEIHKTSLDGVYTFLRPENPAPVIFDSPHSGRKKPADFDYACNEKYLLKAEDRFVDELFADAPSLGAPLLKAEFPRTYLDLNRRIDDIDPEIYEGDWPVGAEGYIPPDPSNRSFAGIGLMRRLIRPGIPVYAKKLTPKAVQNRIDHYYVPYYNALESAIDDLHYRFGEVWHINCHSMPASSVRDVNADRADPSKPIDFVLGNRDGTTCDAAFTRSIQSFLVNLGYNVTINDPYKGVELVERFSSPAQGRHSLQIEINKSLYMMESTGVKNKDFDKIKADMAKLTQFIIDHALANQHPIAAD